ncbi:hypothetical protein BH10PLA1_BH10PLA1_06180 [soil metagenome]
MRDTGMPVEGHIEAVDVDVAYDMLSGHGVVASSVLPDPKPLNIHEELPDAPELADALESALDSSSSQVNFDDLMDQHRGKKVWVIDRDKIRRRVAQVVETAFHLSTTAGESHVETQERIRTALHGLFSDNRNLASERNASSVMGVKYNDPSMGAQQRRPGAAAASMTLHPLNPPAPAPVPQAVAAAPAAPALGGPVNEVLEDQISRLVNVVSEAETILATLRSAARGLGRGEGGGSGRTRRVSKNAMNDEKSDVLLTIYKSNVALLKAYKEQAEPAAAVG